MAQRKRVDRRLHFYSPRLRQKLGELCFARAAIVEAPSGYGKTTAIQDFLNGSIKKGTPIYWYTAEEEAPAACFNRFAETIRQIDNRAGNLLLQTGLPDNLTVGMACDAMRGLVCPLETYLAIDNFHLLAAVLPPGFITALLEHGGEKLHIILITRMMEHGVLETISGRGILHISFDDLRLTAGEIRSYYEKAGVRIPLEAARLQEAQTGGWMIAVYMRLCAYQEKGVFPDGSDVILLIERLIFSRLSKEQQTFLLRLPPLETVTVRQICSLLGGGELPGYVLNALHTPFIRYNLQEDRYEIHSILRMLLERKRKERGAAFERECLLIAGELCKEDDMPFHALGFFFKLRAYDRMLSLDLSSLLFDKIGSIPFFDIALDIANHCPIEVLLAHPLSTLRIAWALKASGADAEFHALLFALEPVVKANAKMLMGEWLLLSSFRHHPCLLQMTAVLKEAVPYFMGGCSQVILPDMPFCFGNGGPLTAYHVTPGQAEKAADALTLYITLYASLTGGHGSGADALYQAELCYHKGDMDDAEIHTYKAVYLARDKGQSTVLLAASLQLAQIALYKNDMEAWQRAMDAMEHAITLSRRHCAVYRSAVDIQRGLLLTELKQLDNIAVWLKEGDFAKQALLPAMMPMAVFVHALYLFHRGEAAKVIGAAEAVLRNPAGGMPFITMLLSLMTAAAYVRLKDTGKAAAFVKRAGEAVLPDGILLNMATFSWELQGMSDALIRREYPLQYHKFQEIKDGFGTGWIKLNRSLLKEKLPEELTAREREVSLLAAQGLRNSEIADRLGLSEATVRAHLRAIFQKLAIDRRARLAESLKPQ